MQIELNKAQQEQFIDECPAWVRQLGIKTMHEWCLVKELMPLSWAGRHDRLAVYEWSLEDITRAERIVIEQTLKAWDEMRLPC